MKAAFIFSGQGAQYPGMGRELYENYEQSKEVFDRAEKAAGFPLKTICFDENQAEILNNTKYCQAAIFTHSIAALKAFEEKLKSEKQNAVKPLCTAGLSLGEYTALTVAGAVDFEDTVKLLCSRGAYMAEACEASDGVMSAVMGISEEDCRKVCAEAGTDTEPVNVSNINTIGQVVISGHREAVARAEALAKEYGGKRAMRLPVSGAYHSVYMAPAADKLEKRIKNVNFTDMSVPVVSNVDAEVILKENIANTLVRQVTATVLWAGCVRKMAALGANTFIEFGPGKALSGFVKKILPEAVVYNVQDVSSLDEAVRGLRTNA